MPFDVYSQAGADAKFLTEVDGGDLDAAPLPITLRRGTTAERDASNPILAAGEPAVVLDSGQPAELVLGDGVTAMADLRAAVWDDDARLAAATTAVQPAAIDALDDVYAPGASASVTGATGLQAQSGRGRFVGVTAGGPPSAGAYQSGDWSVDQTGSTWVCLQPGTPGTWMLPGADVFTPKALTWGDGNNTDVREVPGTLTTPGAAYKDRAYAMAFPIPVGKTITNVYVNVTTAGEAGSVLRAGIYTDDRGWPGSLVADLGTVVATSTGFKTFTAATPIRGGRFVWVVVAAQNCPTTPPATSRYSSTPWHPVSCAGTNADWSTGNIACHASIAGALPGRWPAERYSQAYQQLSPYFNVRYGLDTPRTLYAPDRAPALFATEAWEQGVVQEPNVYWDGARWVMVYSGGWANEVLGWATAPTIDGPWTKHGPLGFGGGRGSILRDGGTLYVYHDGLVRSGPDIEHMGPALPRAINTTAAVTNITNTCVIKDGATYRMIFDGKGPATGVLWGSGYATATSPLGPFTIQAFPLTLAIPMNGGPHLTKMGDGTFSMWYHGGVANLPNDIYHATSTDCITWAAEAAPRITRTAPQEVDQCADPFYVADPSTGTGYLFWSAMDNATPGGVIMRSLPQTMPIAP